MSEVETRPYLVLQAFSHKLDRIERGSTIHLTAEEAARYGADTVRPVDAQGAETQVEPTPATEQASTETGHETPGETTPPAEVTPPASEDVTPPAPETETAPAPESADTTPPATETPAETPATPESEQVA